MITALIVLAYLTTNLYAARHIYAHLRAKAIDKHAGKTTVAGPMYADPVKQFNEWDKGETVFAAVLGSVFWPITLAGIFVWRFVTNSPARSRTELEAERAAMADRIRELEAELDIKEQP